MPQGSVKRMKETLRENEVMKSNRPAGGLSTHLREKHKSGAKKVHRPVFAVGGLDQDMADWNGKEMKEKKTKKKLDKEFTDFDPTKRLRKQGKLGSNSFKSKGKYKRR